LSSAKTEGALEFRSHPLEFLADPNCKHFVVLYEDEHRADLMKFWYLVHGLVKGEHCIYTTHGSVEEARSQMRASGVDIDYYEKSEDFVSIPDPGKDPTGLRPAARKYSILSWLRRTILSAWYFS
jgi:hypothetical protein